MFTRSTGEYAFARWGRPIAPVVFGVTEETLSIIKGAFEAVVGLSGHEMADTDPELGSNCMMFFFRDWGELLDVPDLEQLLPGLDDLVARLRAEHATRYRGFRFDAQGAIRVAFAFVRVQDDTPAQSAETVALAEVVQLMLLWAPAAFRDRSPLAVATAAPETDAGAEQTVILRPEIADLIRAAYDPVMPAVAHDSAHSLRLSARMQLRDT